MSNKNNLKEKIKAISTTRKSSLAEKVKFRLENKKWLGYSSQIAIRIDAILDDKNDFTQIDFAKQLDVSPQQVSKILKGDQNLTLKTIATLSEVLGVELISFPPYKDSFVRLMSYKAEDYSGKMGNISSEMDKVIKEKSQLANTAKTNETMQKNEAILINMEHWMGVTG